VSTERWFFKNRFLSIFKSTREPSLEVAPISLATFSFGDRELWPLTFMFRVYRDTTKMNQLANYLGQRSFRSKVTDRTQHTQLHRRTHTPSDCFSWTTKIVGNNLSALFNGTSIRTSKCATGYDVYSTVQCAFVPAVVIVMNLLFLFPDVHIVEKWRWRHSSTCQRPTWSSYMWSTFR